MTLLSLRAGRLAVDLAPQAGGSIARFAVDGIGDVLRPAPNDGVGSGTARNAACYPLVPFSNRIADGRLSFRGEVFDLPSNWPGIRHPIHGEGWAVPWDVSSYDLREAELLHCHDGKSGWPFRYRARQRFALDERGLTIRLSLENLEPRDVPAGLGLHPFFCRDAETELAARAAGVWLTDHEVLPIERIAVPLPWDFSLSRPVGGTNLDHCFDGWDGRAVVTWPDKRLQVELTAGALFDHLVIYVPAGERYFCVEPASHANGAIGTTCLAEGATLSGEVSFTISVS